MIVAAYELPIPGDYLAPVRIERTGRRNGPTFDPYADVWAIRRTGMCWTTDREWVYEPIPSSRDAAFYAKARWSLDAAKAEAQAVVNALTIVAEQTFGAGPHRQPRRPRPPARDRPDIRRPAQRGSASPRGRI